MIRDFVKDDIRHLKSHGYHYSVIENYSSESDFKMTLLFTPCTTFVTANAYGSDHGRAKTGNYVNIIAVDDMVEQELTDNAFMRCFIDFPEINDW